MSYLNILIIFVVIFITYIIFKDVEYFNPKVKKPIEYIDNINDDKNVEQNVKINVHFGKDTNKYIDKILKHNKNIKLNRYFQETQYHIDYADILTAFNNIAPSQKTTFNPADLPVIAKEPIVSEIKDIIGTFVNEINENVKNVVSNEQNLSGWNYMPNKQIESGWDKQQKALGLPPSLYIEPVKKAPIKLIKIDKLEKYETDFEIRYITYLIMQKINVKDQMVVRVNFILDVSDVNLSREFFDSDKQNYSSTIKIEEIHVIGYMTNKNNGSKSNRKDFYKFEGIYNENGITSDEDIMRELNKKREQYLVEKIV